MAFHRAPAAVKTAIAASAIPVAFALSSLSSPSSAPPPPPPAPPSCQFPCKDPRLCSLSSPQSLYLDPDKNSLASPAPSALRMDAPLSDHRPTSQVIYLATFCNHFLPKNSSFLASGFLKYRLILCAGRCCLAGASCKFNNSFFPPQSFSVRAFILFICLRMFPIFLSMSLYEECRSLFGILLNSKVHEHDHNHYESYH